MELLQIAGGVFQGVLAMQACCLVVMLLAGPAARSEIPGNEIMHLLWNYLFQLYMGYNYMYVMPGGQPKNIAT